MSIGSNSYLKTHPIQKKHADKVGLEKKIFLHAEIAAIIKCKDLSRAHRILITRFDSKGNPVIAKPCPVCMSAISETNISIIDHT